MEIFDIVYIVSLPAEQIGQLQRVQNSAAQLLLKKTKARPYNTTAEWTQLAACEILLWIQDCNSCLPSFWQDTSLLPFSFSLHISDFMHHPIINKKLLKIPKRNLKSIGNHSFSCIAPAVWNSLPASLRNLPILSDFKAQLKTFLFQQAISQI